MLDKEAHDIMIAGYLSGYVAKTKPIEKEAGPLDWLENNIVGAYQGATSPWADKKKAIKAALRKVYSGGKSAVKSVINAPGNIASAVGSGLETGFHAGADAGDYLRKNTGPGIKNTVESVDAGIHNARKELTDILKSTVKTAKSAITKTVDTVSDAAKPTPPPPSAMDQVQKWLASLSTGESAALYGGTGAALGLGTVGAVKALTPEEEEAKKKKKKRTRR
jgi:hypothetical protein